MKRTSLNSCVYDNLVRPRVINKRYLLPNVQRVLGHSAGSVLDFGCGTGCNAFMFQPDLYLGVDLDVDRIAYAKKKYTNYRFTVITRGELPFLDKSFDTIFICGVLHHLDNGECHACIMELIRVLKATGRIVILEPCITTRHPLRNFVMRFFDKGRHIRTAPDYLNIMNECIPTEVPFYFGTPNLYYTVVLTARKQRDAREGSA